MTVDMATMRDFSFWCMIINIGIHLLVVVAWLSLRGFYNRVLI
jgi:hypothetical protein